MLREFISESEWTSLPEVLQKEYKQVPDGEYAGQYRVDSEVTGKLDRIRGTADAAQRTARERAEQLEELREAQREIDALGGLEKIRQLEESARRAEEEKAKEEGTLTERLRELENTLKAKDRELAEQKKLAETNVLSYAARTRLNEELTRLGVPPEVAPMIAGELMKNLKVEGRREDGSEDITAVAKWEGVPRPLDEVMELWGETDVAKRIRQAPPASGGGDGKSTPATGADDGRPTVNLSDSSQVDSHWQAILDGKANLTQ